jgi:PQQ-dependent dehydrogenase (methanol/ethanol family)
MHPTTKGMAMSKHNEAARATPWWLCAGIAACLMAAADAGLAQSAPAAAPRSFVPVTDAMLQNPPPADWLSFRRTLDGWGYSPLDQIDAGNVARLHEVWSMPLEGFTIEPTPLVHDGVMYVPVPGDKIVALDAATGDEIWSFARNPGGGGGGTKRNIAIYQDRLISTSAEGTVFAVDARTGKLQWEVQITGRANTSSGPIIANGKVISGRACAPNSGPDGCVIIANDARTGEELWRTSTIAKPGEPGDETWGGVPWEKRQQVGTWMPPTYDPQLNLVYIGTSVTGPTPKYLLGGNDKQHLYHTSTLALDADTGGIVWYYQHIIDHWDFDHPFDRILVDAAVAPDPDAVAWINPDVTPGEARRVLTGIPGKTGIVYTLDRRTGEFLWAEPTVKQTVVASIDGATGKVHMNPDSVFTHDDQTIDLCPAFTGGKNWMPGAYSPKTGLMYMPLENLCSTVKSAGPKNGEGQLGMRIDYTAYLAPGENDVGEVRAISVSTGRTAWAHEQRAGVMALVATGGGLIFDGDAVGVFRALDDRTGKVLWETQLQGPLSGIPITYGAGGRQFVAVATGGSPEASGLGRMTPEISVGNDRTLHVFTLSQ